MEEKKKRKATPKQLEILAKGRAALDAKRKGLLQSISRADTPATPAPPPEEQLPKVKKIGGRRWWQIYLGLGLLIIAGVIARMYLLAPNNIFIAIFFVLFGASGIFTLYTGLRKRDEGIKFIKPGEEKIKINANCLNIYYGKDDEGNIFCERIAFEEMAKADIVSKYPQRCLDDGKWYYVHIWNPNLEKLVPFTLPDTQYYDPREMVNPVTMPAVQKELKPIPTLGEKLRPVLLVIGIAILSVLFIATGGTPPPPGG